MGSGSLCVLVQLRVSGGRDTTRQELELGLVHSAEKQ